MKIVWRGGRPFKTTGAATEVTKKTNGADNNIISLDDDDDTTMAAAFIDKPEFEKDEEEHDPSRPYPDIVQTLDLSFGVDVLSIAVLPTAILKANIDSLPGLREVKQNLVFAAACGDNVVRLSPCH